MSSNGKLWLYSCSRPLGFPGSQAACMSVLLLCVCVYVHVCVCILMHTECQYAVESVCCFFVCVCKCSGSVLGRSGCSCSSPSLYLRNFLPYSRFFFIYSTLKTYSFSQEPESLSTSAELLAIASSDLQHRRPYLCGFGRPYCPCSSAAWIISLS